MKRYFIPDLCTREGDEVRLDLVVERLEQIADAPHWWYIKICESIYAQGINAIRPDPGAYVRL